MAVAVSNPTNDDGRLSDVRSLVFRIRLLSFSGNYATGGETITAESFGFNRVIAVAPLDLLIRAAAGVTGVLPVFDVASNGKSVVVRALEDAAGAAGAPLGQEKTNAEAYIASSILPVLVIGY